MKECAMLTSTIVGCEIEIIMACRVGQIALLVVTGRLVQNVCMKRRRFFFPLNQKAVLKKRQPEANPRRKTS